MIKTGQSALYWLKRACLLAVFMSPVAAPAQGGAECATTGMAKRFERSTTPSRYIENTCKEAMYVFWCVEGEHRRACKGPKLYHQFHTMAPGERYFNDYSLPSTDSIRLGACAGKRRNVVFSKDGSGAYACQPVTGAVAMIDCGGGAEPFQSSWTIKAVRRSGPVLRFETIETHTVLPLLFDEFSALERGETPEKVSQAFCGQSVVREQGDTSEETSPSQLVNELKARFRDHHNALFEKRVEACRNQPQPDAECKRLLDSLKNTYRGSPVSR